MDPSETFKHESLEDTASLVSYLRALTDAFASGRIKLSDASGEMVLEPKGLLNFELRAVQRRGRARVTLEFDWRVGDRKQLSENALSIESGPVPEKPEADGD